MKSILSFFILALPILCNAQNIYLPNGAEGIQSTITENNNVGVGTSSPRVDFEVSGSDMILSYRDLPTGLHIRTDNHGDSFINNMDGFVENGLEGNGKLFVTGMGGIYLQTAKDGAAYGTSGKTRMYINDENGWVGINTESPQATLDVQGMIAWGSSGSKLTNDAGAAIELKGNGTPYIDFSNSSEDDFDARFVLQSDDLLSLAGANLVIGKSSQTNSNYKLEVYGPMRANEIVVNTTGADFVFEESYNLPSLDYVEKYIIEHHHLPEVPSAEDMQENGMSVGQLNTTLLQKVEELTLYILELKKQNEELSDRLDKLEQ